MRHPTKEELRDAFKEKELRHSPQREHILDYIAGHHCHPSAQEIYEGLLAQGVGVSLMTVYSTLATFEEADLLWSFASSKGELRYDTVLNNHGHFICRTCDAIYNYKLPGNMPSDLQGFEITNCDIKCRGYCPNCLSERHCQ